MAARAEKSREMQETSCFSPECGGVPNALRDVHLKYESAPLRVAYSGNGGHCEILLHRGKELSQGLYLSLSAYKYNINHLSQTKVELL